MILILQQQAPAEKIARLVTHLEAQGLSVNYSQGENTTILGLIGDTATVDLEGLAANEVVAKVQRVSEPYKRVNRKFHTDDTVVRVGDIAIGGGHFGMIAGPCSVESYEQLLAAANCVKAAGAQFLRGGAFKPRTSPYAFRGLKAEGLEILKAVKKETGLPIVTELTSLEYLDLYDEVDIIQVGARNMQNFDMLSELGHCQTPILLKRGLSSTLEELLMSAEYILAGGNQNVILCERGIRTFETATRNTLDLAAVPLLRSLSHLPVLVDPSHSTGAAALVPPMCKAAVVAGADGLIVEVHPTPSQALCDGAQSLTLPIFTAVMADVKKLCAFEGKSL